MSARPRRSCLYMPGANAKALEKAKTLPADVLLLDLEDSVAPEAKEDARVQVVNAVKGGGYGKREIIIRANALATQWGKDDIIAGGSAKPDGLLAPKVSSADEVIALDNAMTAAGFPDTATLWVMIETPRAFFNIAEIAATAQKTRLSAFVLGLNDLAKETRARASNGRAAFYTPLSLAVLAARAEGISAIDGVFNDISDSEGLVAECRQGLEFGYDGKTLIHPSQIETANLIFAPHEDELIRARAVIAGFALPENAGKGVIKVDGKMTELLHLEEAKRLVEMAATIESLSA
ncbi:MAG: CoA ester lyase [Hyphomonadaceae bacterium JAD_PAG50586_4]|nr:MAG: CoA ester lyase [Hyphomonadaceae bacterium JAD_PAG50586_4]